MRKLDKSDLLFSRGSWHTTSMMRLILVIFLFFFTSYSEVTLSQEPSNPDQELKAQLLEQIERANASNHTFRELAIIEAKAENFGLSKGYLLTALQLDPWDLKSWKTLRYLKEVSSIGSSFEDHSSWQVLYRAISMRIEFWRLTILTLFLFFWFSIHSVRIYGRYRRAKKTETPFTFRIFWYTTFGVLVLSSLVLWINKVSFEGNNRIVVQERTSLKTFYGPDSPEFGQAEVGTEAIVTEKTEGWIFIRLLDGRVGWIQSDKAFRLQSVWESI